MPKRNAKSPPALHRNQLIASVAGTFQVLEVFARHQGAVPLSAFVDITGRPKGSVHRILSTLVNLGCVEQDSKTGRYRLTLKLWQIGIVALADLDVVKVARPHLERLMSAADETVHLAVLDPSGGTVYVSKVESPRSIRVQTQLGRINPSWCTATGRALLAFHPEAADRVLQGALEQRTPQTVTDPASIRKSLADVAAKGYAVTKAENHPEMGGIAAPVRDHSGTVIAACGVAIPAFRMDRALIERCAALVTHAADAISRDLGFQNEQHRGRRYGT